MSHYDNICISPPTGEPPFDNHFGNYAWVSGEGNLAVYSNGFHSITQITCFGGAAYWYIAPDNVCWGGTFWGKAENSPLASYYNDGGSIVGIATDGVCEEWSSSSSSTAEYSHSSSSSSETSSSSEFCCTNPNWNGSVQFSGWSFTGMNPSNTDNCVLYVVESWYNPNQRIYIYKDLARLNLVASGINVGGGAQTITLNQANSSGLNGQVNWGGNPVNENTYYLQCPDVSSSSTSSMDFSSSSSTEAKTSSSETSMSSSSSSSKSISSSSSSKSESSSSSLDFSSSSSSSSSKSESSSSSTKSESSSSSTKSESSSSSTKSVSSSSSLSTEALPSSSSSTGLVFTLIGYLCVEINGSNTKNHYLPLYNHNIGTSTPSDRDFWGDIVASPENLVEDGFISMTVNGSTYWLHIYTADPSSSCCTNLQGTFRSI